MTARRYVYALSDTRFPRLRVAGRTIVSVKVGALYAAAASLDSVPPISEETLQEQHAIVLQLAERVDAILPMRFGALVDDDELEQFVRVHRRELSAALDLVHGREQMTVRLFAPAPRGRGRAPMTGSLQRPAMSGTDYLRHRRQAAQPRPLPAQAAYVQRAVSGLVRAERSDAGDGPVSATLWHLIERGAAQTYRDAIQSVAAKMAPFRLTTSGPWPPFAFVPRLRP